MMVYKSTIIVNAVLLWFCRNKASDALLLAAATAAAAAAAAAAFPI